jgi:hypothetical protein
MTTFVRGNDGSWQRDDERHENTLIDTSRIPALLRPHKVDVILGSSFGSYELPAGLVSLVGRHLRRRVC